MRKPVHGGPRKPAYQVIFESVRSEFQSALNKAYNKGYRLKSGGRNETVAEGWTWWAIMECKR